MSLRQKSHEWMEMDVNGWYGEAVGEGEGEVEGSMG